MSGGSGTMSGRRPALRWLSSRRGMDVALGVVLGMVLAASLWAGWRLVAAPRRVIDPGSVATQGAVHAAISLLPHLRRGLAPETAQPSAAHLRLLTGADAVALADADTLLAFDGAGDGHHRAGDPLATIAEPGRGDDVRVLRRLDCPDPGCPLRSAIVAPLLLQGERAGSLVALYELPGRVRVEESRVVAEAAALVSAMIELSELDAQGERLARAELQALRAQISPHFIYNALTAVASFIHSRPEEARELLGEFSEFIRYAFARQRPYVSLADELQYVEKYLRLEQARFGERLRVRVRVDPEVLQAVVPVLSVQPLVENAVRHGVESRPARRARRDPRARPRRRRRAARVRRRRGHRPGARPPRARRRGAGHRPRQRARAPAVDVRAQLRAGDRERQQRRDHRRHDAAEVPRRGARGVSERLTLLAVDDERPALEDLVRMLESSPAVGVVRAAGSGQEALVSLAEERCDGLFLDVRMPGLDGLELARVLRRFERPPAVVFVSAFDDFAVSAFELEALDYLVKPVTRKRLDEAITRVRRAATAPRRRRGRAAPGVEDDVLPVDALRGGGTRLLGRSSILVLQAHGDYVRVASDEGRYLLRARLVDLEERWSRHGFLRVHRVVRGQPAARGRGAAAAQRDGGAGDGRRHRGPDRAPPGVGAAAAAGGVIGRTPRDELRETTEHGGLYLRRLMRSQLSLSLLAVTAFGGLMGSLPLALYLLPGLQDIQVLGLPLPMLIVMVPLFPIFLAFGWVYERRAQALEEDFRDLVEPPE